MKIFDIISLCYNLNYQRACSSVDRASASGAEGQGFESPQAHHFSFSLKQSIKIHASIMNLLIINKIICYVRINHSEKLYQEEKIMPLADNGNIYVPFNKRSGNESIVYFTRDLSSQGLRKIFSKVSSPITGKVAIKLHTGEPKGPNIIPREWVKDLIEQKLPGSHIVETNAYYEGGRYTTKQHRETLEINGWTFAPVDIMDENGTAMIPVKNGHYFTEMSVGKNMLNYDSLLVLTHFKGHIQGGFGGSNKNIGIGCADGRIGKAMIHTTPNQDNQWDIANEEFMERISESSKATIDYFKNHISFINVMRNMSVSCDCEGVAAEPVVTPNVGILASLDIAAIDYASVDLIYAMPEKYNHDLVERMVSRRGLRQLSYMHELGMGNAKYSLIDIDNGDAKISLEEAVKHIKPFEG